MLLVRAEQMHALQAVMRDRFVEKMLSLLAELWPTQTARMEGGFRRFVESAINRAFSYGIDTQASVARFINLCMVWGFDFEMRPEHAWALRILRDSNLRSALKVDELASRTRQELAQRRT